MSFLAAPALILLIALPVLLWLAPMRREPSRLEVGTLMIWRRVASLRPQSSRRRRRFDLLLWIVLAAALLGALGAARPAILAQTPTARAAVFIERLGAGDREPGLAAALARARAELPDAELEFYIPLTSRVPGLSSDVIMLAPGSIEAELAQFEYRTRHADARLLLLCQLTPGAERLGRVVPRATAAISGGLFSASVHGETLLLRSTRGEAPQVEGALLVTETQTGPDVLREYRIYGDMASIADSRGNAVSFTRRPFGVGVGEAWNSRRHVALYSALQADSGETPDVWLGADELRPAVRINVGEASDVAAAEISYDPAHALFADLPLAAFDWAASSRLLPVAASRRPLVSAVIDGERVGDLVALDESARVLWFAGDPFSEAPVAEAALLLDNAIGVLTGERASRRARYSMEGELPSERAARVAPFEAHGEIPQVRAEGPFEFATWLMTISALCALVAAVAARRLSA